MPEGASKVAQIPSYKSSTTYDGLSRRLEAPGDQVDTNHAKSVSQKMDLSNRQMLDDRKFLFLLVSDWPQEGFAACGYLLGF